MPRNHFVLLDNPQSCEMVKRTCAEHGFKFDAFKELIYAELKQVGKQKKRGLRDEFDDILDRIAQGD